MGSLRRRLVLPVATLAFAPLPAWAEVCEKVRPDWIPGSDISVVSEAISLLSSPVSIILLLASALAIRLRAQWWALAVVVFWTIWVTIISADDPAGIQKLAKAEGCIGSPSLFFAIVGAICVGMIIYTAPLRRSKD